MDLVLALREFRRRSGLTQEQVAKLSGISVKSISSWETGARIDSIKARHLAALALVYGVHPSEFFRTFDELMVLNYPVGPLATLPQECAS